MLAAFDLWILSFSAITVIATIWMGFWAAGKSRTASDFFVAGRGVSVGWNASAISGEYLSAASFMGIAGMVMSSGYDALWYPVCYACGYLFLLLFIAGPLRRFGAYTIPDFAEGRYDSPLFRRIAVIFVLFIGFFYTMPQMKGAGTTLSYIFQDISWFGQKGLPYPIGVVIVGAVITFNVALGGMKGITLVQAFQYWLKMFAISVPVFVLMSVYGGYGRQLEVNEPARTAPAAATAGESFARPALPAKAPSDSSWINPFGPLTTKAAKAARGTVTSRVPLTAIDAGSGAGAGLVPAWFSARLQAQTRSIQFPATQVPWDDLMLQWTAYASIRRLEWNPTVTNTPITWPTTQAMKPGEFLELLTRVLATNGITLVHDHGTARLFPSADRVDHAIDPRPYALLYTYSLIIALVCGTAGLPHILVRFYTNPDGVSAKRTTMWVMILIGVFYVFPPVFGVMGRNLMPALYEGAGAKGTDKVVLELPRVLDSGSPTPAPAGTVSPDTSPAARGTAARQTSHSPWGSILSGITCAGAFAAFMSTFSGLLVSMTGALAHDVYGRILRPQSTPADRMRMFKWCAVLIGGVATLLGCFVEPLEINFMVGQAFAIAAASYFPLLFMSVWWRGMTIQGAATGMLSGGLCALVAVALTNASNLALDKGPMGRVFAAFKPLNDFWAEHPLLRILCEQPAIWTVPLAIGLMLLVSRLTAASRPSDIRMKMLVLHAPEKLGLKQDYIREHEAHGH